jgi:hypothetical protein
MTLNRILQLLFAASAMGATANASSIFTFDNDNLGTSTTFTDTVNGVSATFSSAADPGGFVVYASMFETLTGNVLGDPGPAGQNNLPLDVAFSGELNAIELDFATADFNTPSPLTLTAYQGTQMVGSTTTSGMFLPGFLFPEGEIAFDGADFNNVVISSTSMDFAVDNIAVNAVPEPGPLSLVVLGFSLLVIGSLRNKRRASAASHN